MSNLGQGPVGPQGIAGVSSTIETVAICSSGSGSGRGTCSCNSSLLISKVNAPCQVTSNTGSCSADVHLVPSLPNGTVNSGQCCVRGD